MYVDDLLESLDSVQKAISMITAVTQLTSRGGFRITGWLSNKREVLAAVSETERKHPTLDLDLDDLPVERALGVLWDIEKDVFRFRVLKPERPATKRGILSTISSLYDPIGFVCPVVLEAKRIMQVLWKMQIGWDDPLPEEVLTSWEQWKAELGALSGIEVLRCYTAGVEDEVKEITLHNFADASEDGYGVCAYLRFQFTDGSVRCAFLCARSRCAPIKPNTIPRLELKAATPSVKMYLTVKDEIDCHVSRVFFWSDSQTALQYIKNDTKRFHTYVANRVTEIREATDPGQWRHCPGVMNPADEASRGLSPDKLAKQQR
ncbi:uncharacterized protein LOC135487854 [Lineus longissimus]|uniref:uncharacterized protein LOC135487854 n=1 Tax=Lineus longissimus TaxID=88925 RepID=UPI00315CE96D